MPKKTVNFGFRVNEARQEELKVIAARRRQSVQQMLEQGLERLLAEEGWEPERAYSATSRYRDWHEKLETILESGDSEVIEAVVSNIEVFFDRLKPKTGSKAPIVEAGPLDAEEARLVEEYRNSTFEKRRRMLAFAAKVEDLGPEVLPAAKQRNRKHG